MNRTVFYLGPPGTFSHILARARFWKNDTFIPCATFSEVATKVVLTDGSLGLLPIENTSSGTVYDALDTLLHHAGNIHIHEELALRVRIAFIGRQGGAITDIYSHAVQLKRYESWLRGDFPNARIHAVESTALAAQKAADTEGGAALAAPSAGSLYGLSTLLMPPAKEVSNITRFFVVGAGAGSSPRPATKTAIAVRLPDECGSLHRFLGPFARKRVNLSRIVSRPIPGDADAYRFFIELGSAGDRNTDAALFLASQKAATITPMGAFATGRTFNS